MDERIVSPESTEQEEIIEKSLRPHSSRINTVCQLSSSSTKETTRMPKSIFPIV